MPGRSDIDLLILVENPLAQGDIDALVSAVRGAEMGAARSIDLLVVDVAMTRSPIQDPAFLVLVEWHPAESTPLSVEAGQTDADLVAEFAMARASGHALYGSAPSEVIGPVPREWIEARGRHWLKRWIDFADDGENAAFMVLTACRMWRYAVDGVHCSKADAARWALERDPSLAGITHALRQRTEDPTQPVPAAEVLAVLNAALNTAP